jgi:hypothetical protein
MKHHLSFVTAVCIVLVFGLWMALRSGIHSIWLRALMAGCAFAFLGFAIRQFRSGKARR